MSWARNLLEDPNTQAHVSSSQEDCARSVGDLRPEGFGRVCPVIWDGYLCWPPTLAGTTIKQPCPVVQSSNTKEFAYKQCMRNGTWYRDWIPGAPQGWTNYTQCVSHDRFVSTADAAFSVFSNDLVTVPGLDVTTAMSGSTTYGNISTETEPSAAVAQDSELPIDAMLGTVVHGISAVCLLLALVTWITLKLTDRLATKRYQLLTAAVVAAFFFHIIVLTTHFHAISVALRPEVLTTTAFPLQHGTGNVDSRSGTFAEGSDGMGMKSSSSDMHVRAASNGDLSPGTGRAYAGSSEIGNRFYQAELEAYANSKSSKREIGTDMADTSGKIDRGRTTAKTTTRFFVIVDYDQDDDKDRRDRSIERTSGDGSWMTLCEVGHAFYLLSDVAVYSLLFSMSLYYTLVALGKSLNFKRLVSLFLLGVGVPAIFVIFSIMLYAFLPSLRAEPRIAESETGLGLTCAVASIADELHWVTTGPKLACIVLSMCLLTVTTYGFWRLNYPALHTSSETFYASQGIVKTLLFLFIGSLIELFFLVTQYQKMYWLTVYRPLWLTTTVALGLKGFILSMLCCFLDSEVLHGTCCPSTYHNVAQTTGCENAAGNWGEVKNTQSNNDAARQNSKPRREDDRLEIEMKDMVENRHAAARVSPSVKTV